MRIFTAVARTIALIREHGQRKIYGILGLGKIRIQLLTLYCNRIAGKTFLFPAAQEILPADIRLLVIPGRIQHVPEAILHLHIIPHMPFPGAIAFQRSARYQHRRYSKTAT